MVAGIRKSSTKTCNRVYAERSMSIRDYLQPARPDEFEASFLPSALNGFFIINNHRTIRTLASTTKPDWRNFH
jgi:hypothetical protein